MCPATADTAFAGIAAAVFVNRRDANECGDLFSVEASEFREIAEEGVSEDLADTIDADQQFLLFLPLRRLFDEFVELCFDPFDFGLQVFQMPVQAGMQGLGQDGAAVLFHGGELQELAAPGEQVTDLADTFGLELSGFGFERLPESGNDLGIEAVGFGQVKCLIAIGWEDN